MRILLLGDTHFGSRWAVADPADTPRYCPGKEIQKRLFERWQAGAENEGRFDAMVLDGDAVDGQGRKDGGSKQWTADIDEQIAHGARLLKMWQCKRYFVLGGSGYHVNIGDTGVSAEELLARAIGAEAYPHQDYIPAAQQRRCGPHWFLTFDKVTVHCAHHVSVSRVFHYASTPLAREMMNAKLNDPVRREWERMYRESPGPRKQMWQLQADLPAYTTRMVVRAHAHYWWLSDAGATAGVLLPAWKVPDPHIQTRNSLGFGHLGYVVLETNGEDWSVEKHLYRIEDVQHPPHTIIKSGRR